MEIDELRRIAAKEELSLNYVAKDEMISKVLLNLQGFDDMILKGGTAINRLYLKNRRFSEDIDFDLVFKGKVKKAVARTREIINKMSGFEIAVPRIMNATIRYDLSYENPLGNRDKIRLEFRVTEKAAGYSKKIINFGFVPYESSLHNVYDINEMLKFKIECILNRIEGKDFFDLFHLLELPHKDIKLSKRQKEMIIKRISLDKREIKSVANILNHYIPKNKRPSWGIFIDELRARIRQL